MAFLDQAVTRFLLSYISLPGKMEKIFLKDWQHFNILVFYMGNYKYGFIS